MSLTLKLTLGWCGTSLHSMVPRRWHRDERLYTDPLQVYDPAKELEAHFDLYVGILDEV